MRGDCRKQRELILRAQLSTIDIDLLRQNARVMERRDSAVRCA